MNTFLTIYDTEEIMELLLSNLSNERGFVSFRSKMGFQLTIAKFSYFSFVIYVCISQTGTFH